MGQRVLPLTWFEKVGLAQCYISMHTHHLYSLIHSLSELRLHYWPFSWFSKCRLQPEGFLTENAPSSDNYICRLPLVLTKMSPVHRGLPYLPWPPLLPFLLCFYHYITKFLLCIIYRLPAIMYAPLSQGAFCLVHCYAQASSKERALHVNNHCPLPTSSKKNIPKQHFGF